MPNWTTNEVTISSYCSKHIKEIKDIFEKGCPFNQLIKEPKWDSVPLKGNEVSNRFNKQLLGKKGELPIIEEHKLRNGEVMKLRKFKSTNVQDTRWYDWRWEKWGTKWDVPKNEIEITEINNGSIVIGFDTAWSPPIAIYKKLRNKFKDVKIEWWFIDEDDDSEGEGYYLK